MNNPIRNLVKAKIKSLLAQYSESSSITHNATKGALREQYLSEFMRDILPSKFLIKSGFITCSKSEIITPQIDLIVSDKMSIPNFSLNESISFIPIESALLMIEVKSKLITGKNDALSQIQTQTDVLTKLEYDFINRGLFIQPRIVIPSVIVSYDTNLSITKLKDWLNKSNNLIGICVIGKFSILKLDNPNGIGIVKNKGDNEETLFFFSRLYFVLSTLLIDRSNLETKWESYLSDSIPDMI